MHLPPVLFYFPDNLEAVLFVETLRASIQFKNSQDKERVRSPKTVDELRTNALSSRVSANGERTNSRRVTIGFEFDEANGSIF